MRPAHVASRLSVGVAPRILAFGFVLCAAATVQAGLSYEQVIMADNPAAYWRFEESSTALPAADTATADGAQNGAYFGTAALGTGKVGQGLLVTPANPIGGYMRADNVTITQAFTVEVWARSNTPTWEAWGWIASSRNANGFIIHPRVAAAPGTREWNGYAVTSSTGFPQIGAYVPADIQDWHHYVISYDGANNGRMYFDGALVVNNMGFSSARAASSLISVYAGNDGGLTGVDRRGNGAVDEVAVYNSALSADQVATHYYATTGARAFSGPGDLDLTGDFQYAVNVGYTSASTVGTIRDATFTGEGVAGVLVQSENLIYPAWGTKPEYGSSAEDNLLEDIMRSIRYDSSGTTTLPGVQITLDVTPGQKYKLQLLISENAGTARGGRSFNIKVDNAAGEWETLLANLDPLGPTGPWSGQPTEGTVFTYHFFARGDTFKVLLDPGVMFANHDAILNAFTLERVPEPSTFVIFGLGAALLAPLGWRRRRR